jgi:EAL domain-containing protein (putative c-di-GMP-specific phosphodiesterase class I)
LSESSAFFSIWTQASDYWLILDGARGKLPVGFDPIAGSATLAAMHAGAGWPEIWREIESSLGGGATPWRAAVIAGEDLPPHDEIARSLRPLREISAIAENLWLIHDMQEGRLGCYMQRVVDRRGKLVGYEAFARMEAKDGGVVGGGAIMQAARALSSEYQIDRILHKQAVGSFVARDLAGHLFINFLTGFIQRPEVYFDGLSQATKHHHVRAGAIVLDVPLAGYMRDLPKLKSIAEYCRARGFALALDDVSSVDGLAALLAEIRPAFVKLDGKFGQHLNEVKRRAVMGEVVRLAHEIGANVLGEGVENQATYDLYFNVGVDLFQGYLIGAPERHDLVPQVRAQA